MKKQRLRKRTKPKLRSRTKGLTILLAGRPYHTDPLIQHKLSEMIANLGVNVISEDIARVISLQISKTSIWRTWRQKEMRQH